MANLRIWSVALYSEELSEISWGQHWPLGLACSKFEPDAFKGGAYPHSLYGSWDLRSGDTSTTYGPMAALEHRFEWEQIGDDCYDFGACDFDYAVQLFYPYWRHAATREVTQTKITGAGDFVRGGPCNFNACPVYSESGCPLGRSLDFKTVEQCEAFAAWNFCKLAGDTRARPNYPHLNGCHAGPVY